MFSPPKIGHMPRKIECSFASVTADDWKNWILIYSVFLLCMESLLMHVGVCLLTAAIFSPSHIDDGHISLTEFCNKLLESLYGTQCCTPYGLPFVVPGLAK